MESQCVAKYLRVAPRKLRLVADLVRGKGVNEAISLLKLTPKAGSKPALKAIQSAVANVVNQDMSRKVNPDELFVRTIFVDEGPVLKRYLPRAMGRATPLRKRMSHLTVWVATPPEETAEVEAAPEVPAVEKPRARAKKPSRPTHAPIKSKGSKAKTPVKKSATKSKLKKAK